MKGVIEKGEEQHREIAEAQLRDKRRGKRERNQVSPQEERKETVTESLGQAPPSA